MEEDILDELKRVAAQYQIDNKEFEALTKLFVFYSEQNKELIQITECFLKSVISKHFQDLVQKTNSLNFKSQENYIPAEITRYLAGSSLSSLKEFFEDFFKECLKHLDKAILAKKVAAGENNLY